MDDPTIEVVMDLWKRRFDTYDIGRRIGLHESKVCRLLSQGRALERRVEPRRAERHA